MLCGRKKCLISLAGRCTLVQSQYRLAQVQTAGPKSRRKALVKIPKKKSWSKNAVLASLVEAIPMDPCANAFYPLTTIDLAPSTSRQEESMQKAVTHGKDTVQFLKDKESDIMKFDWTVESEIKAGIAEAPPVLCTLEKTPSVQSERLPTAILDDLMAKGDLKTLGRTYKELLKNETEIPDEVKEKMFAFACFNCQQQDGLEFFLSVVKSETHLTKYMYDVVLRTSAISMKSSDVQNWYFNMRKAGFVPDAKTVDMVFQYANRDSIHFIQDFVSESVKMGWRPTAATILQTKRHLFTTKAAGNGVNGLAKCWREIEQCTTESTLDMLVELLVFASDGNFENNAVCAILELIAQNQIDTSDTLVNPKGFARAMKFALRSGDLLLGRKIFETTMPINVNLRDGFYMNYIELLGSRATPEEFVESCTQLIGMVLLPTPHTYRTLLKICANRIWPQVLPFAFSLFDQVLRKPETHMELMAVAIRLHYLADPQTVSQLINVSYILLDFGKAKPTPRNEYFSLLSIMFSKYGEKEDVIKMLAKIPNFSNRLNQAALQECEKVLGSDAAKILHSS